jgi:hypothetical protein
LSFHPRQRGAGHINGAIISKLALSLLRLSKVEAVVVAGVSAEEAPLITTVADLKAPQGAKPRDCKCSYATAAGPGPAQAISVATVNA